MAAPKEYHIDITPPKNPATGKYARDVIVTVSMHSGPNTPSTYELIFTDRDTGLSQSNGVYQIDMNNLKDSDVFVLESGTPKKERARLTGKEIKDAERLSGNSNVLHDYMREVLIANPRFRDKDIVTISEFAKNWQANFLQKTAPVSTSAPPLLAFNASNETLGELTPIFPGPSGNSIKIT